MLEARDVRNPRVPARVVKIRTDDWPEHEREAMFREVHGREGIRVEPRPDEPLRIDATLIKFPDLALLWGRRSPLRSEFADGDDRLIFNLGGPAIAMQFGRELVLGRGDAVALSGSDRGALTTMRTGRIATLEFPRGGLLPLLKHPRHRCAHRIPQDSPALYLLRGYLRAAQASGGIGTGDLPPMAIAHIYDLAAMAVGAGRQAENVANGRGVRAARLQAIKDDVLAQIEHEMSLDAIAARHRVSPRYVRMLFASEGTTLTEFVREERLKRARSMLLSTRFAARRIGEIAYAVGFNDLSYFNRSFRRRFGQSPSEVRAIGRVE
jgi:AraC-like DNA-binding protein